jgi:hypothetical protein
MPPNPGMEPGLKGTVRIHHVPMMDRKADGLNCTGRHHHDAPGYHTSDGEATKRTLETSVLK